MCAVACSQRCRLVWVFGMGCAWCTCCGACGVRGARATLSLTRTLRGECDATSPDPTQSLSRVTPSEGSYGPGTSPVAATKPTPAQDVSQRSRTQKGKRRSVGFVDADMYGSGDGVGAQLGTRSRASSHGNDAAYDDDDFEDDEGEDEEDTEEVEAARLQALREARYRPPPSPLRSAAFRLATRHGVAR